MGEAEQADENAAMAKVQYLALVSFWEVVLFFAAISIKLAGT